MPSLYAHYRFGTGLLPEMPGDARRTIQRFRQLFDMGLHGPDIFFYSSPILRSGANFLGVKYHEQTGEDFFARVCRNLRLMPSEAANAYLYGVLCHYCLDTVCHPYVVEVAAKGEVTHAQLETEFERLLLERDGKIPACSYDMSGRLQLTPGECETVARFYPPASANQIRDSVKSMAMFTKLFATREGVSRTVVEKGIRAVSKSHIGMFMAEKPLPLCLPYLPDLEKCYDQAVALFPTMLEQLQAHMTYSAPFGEEFKGNFG